MKIVFMGTPAAAVPSLERLYTDGHEIVAVYTQPDRPAGRGQKLTAPPVKECAASHGTRVFQPAKIKTEDALSEFESLNADLAVVVAYGRILTERHLNAFTHGAINVHFSLLPKYRGAAPVNWAIVNGETVTGVTTMKMDTGLDTGDILLQSETRIGPEENAIELMDRLALEGADLLLQTLANLESISPKPQYHSNATLAPLMKKADGLIDWTMDAKAVHDRVRGFQPFPTAFSYFRSKRVTFFASRVEGDAARDRAEPGSISRSNGMLGVVCGDGTVLRILELQVEGKRRVSGAEFLNGFDPSAGERFEGLGPVSVSA